MAASCAVATANGDTAPAVRQEGSRQSQDLGQDLGSPVGALFIFCAMHLSTRSARLSRLAEAAPFSVPIQHSRAARVWVIGSSTGLAAACGPLPVVSQASSVRPPATSKRAADKRGKSVGRMADIQTVV